VFRYGSKANQVLRLGAEEEPYELEYFTRCDPDACKLTHAGDEKRAT
jgi:hypothetical protein